MKSKKADKNADTATFEVQALSGATLDATFAPKGGFTGPMTLIVRTPAGVEVDVTSFQQALGNGGLQLSSLPLDVPGTYEIEIGGYSKSKNKVSAKLTPTQPPHAAGVVKIL